MDLIGGIWTGFWHLLLNVLVAINSVVGSAGVSIIIFTILMRMLTVPFTLKALHSSKHMQAVQPILREAQKRHGKDKEKLREEQMRIYRDYGINPAAGCLPMLLQLPIFFGLFSALSFVLPTTGDIAAQLAANQEAMRTILWNPDWVNTGASNFRQPFFWLENLGAADPFFIWPVLSGIFQFFQSRMAMPHRDPNNPMDPQQKMMNNIMQFMPIYIVFISAGFPAGTVIYWAFSSLFGAVLQYFITGFGSLPDLPGFKWLPRKAIEPPKQLDEERLAELAAKKKGGIMGRMMEKALEAQEAQRAAPDAAGAAASTSGGSNVSQVRAPQGTQSRGSGRAPKVPARTRPPSTMLPSNGETGKAPVVATRYASDARRAAEGDAGNGASPAGAAALPKKRKNKR